MKKSFIYLLLVGLFFSCNDDDLLLENVSKSASSVNNKIQVTEEGFLSFPSFSTLEAVITDIESGEELGISPQTTLTRTLNADFESVTTISNHINQLKNNHDVGTVIPLDPIMIEDMTEDEFRLMKAEDLLLDDVLTELMDTTLRISINDTIYKITDNGTFFAHKSKIAEIDNAIQNFDLLLKINNEAGAVIKLNKDVAFTNTFGGRSVHPIAVTTIPNPVNYTPDFHNGYNCTIFSWKNNSLWQKFWDMIRGKDVTKEVEFDKNNRVQVEVFNVNYQFYATSGIKVKMQKRKKFLGIPYWKERTADKMAIGFNMLSGEMKYMNPRSFSNITSTGSTGWSKFTSTINNIPHGYILGVYHKFEIIKDWVDKIYFCMPEVNIPYPGGGYTVPNFDLFNKLYDVPAEQVFSQLKNLAGKYVYNPVQTKIQPKDPRMSYFAWGNATVTYNKDKSYIIGVKEYTNISSKTIRFDRSCGFSINNGAVSGFIPTEFIIKDLDMFGACYCNNQWKGVRFVK